MLNRNGCRNRLSSPSLNGRATPFQLPAMCDNHPPVSIILCTLGTRASLNRCLESLLAQNCACCEIILVLNASMNDAFAMAMAKYSLTLLSEQRPGVCAARNRAIPLAKGEIIAFVDDDIVAHSNWLHELLKGFRDLKVACVTGRIVPEGPIPLTKERIERYYCGERAMSSWSLSASDPASYARAIGDPVGFGCNMAFRKEFLQTHALFPEDLGAGSVIGGGDEFYMFVQVLKQGFRIHHTPDAVVTHYFEEDVARQRVRSRQICEGAAAFATKLIIEEKGIRMGLLRWGITALTRRLGRLKVGKKLSSEPQELLSSTEKIAAYLRGPFIYWKSRASAGQKKR